MFDHSADSRDIKAQTVRLPTPGEIMPDFTLVSTSGTQVRISDYRGRRNLILIFSGRGESETVRGLLRQFSEQYSEFVTEEALVLAVVQGTKGRAGQLDLRVSLPFPFLVDEESRVHNLTGVLNSEDNYTPVVYVVDRYGEVRHVCRVEEARSAYTAGAILDWVRYINLECPE